MVFLEPIFKLFQFLWWVLVEIPIGGVAWVVSKILEFLFAPFVKLANLSKVKKLEEDTNKCTPTKHLGEPTGTCVVCGKSVCDVCEIKIRGVRYCYDCYRKLYFAAEEWEKQKKEQFKRNIIALIDFMARFVLFMVMVAMVSYIGLWFFAIVWSFYRPGDVYNLLQELQRFHIKGVIHQLGPTWSSIKGSINEFFYGSREVEF